MEGSSRNEDELQDADNEKSGDDHSDSDPGSGSEDVANGQPGTQSDSDSDPEYRVLAAQNKDQALTEEDVQDIQPTFVYEKESLAGLSSFIKKSIANPLTYHDRTGYSLLVACIRECLLTHRWQEASQAIEMACIYPTHKLDDYVWKCGMEVLYNSPDSDPAMIEHFTRRLEGNCRQRRRKRLELAFYFLSKGQFRDAEVEIQSSRIRGRISTNKEELRSDRYWQMMNKAYSGMLKYRKWQEEYQQGALSEYSMQDACGGLGSVPDKPGVWDIFITKQVELLETDSRVDDARELLQKNCTLCKDNPNAYRYMYRHLERTNGDREEIIRILKEYVKRIPSDLLALELVSLLQQTAKRKNPNYSSEICLITNTLFDMLDYPCWYKRLAPWKALAKHLTKILKKQDRVAIDAVMACWSSREWWPSYHFNARAVKGLLKKNKKVALQKAVVAMVMHKTDSSFVRRVRRYFTKQQDKKSVEQLHVAFKLANDFAESGVK